MGDGDAGRPGLLRRLWARRWVRFSAMALAVLAPLGALGGTAGWRYMKTNPNFCVGCHLMEEPAEKWRHSAHRMVACQVCHRADIFEEMSLGWATFIERPEKIGPHTSMPISICAECHASDDLRWKQIAATPGHKAHFVERDISCLSCHATKVHEFKVDTAKCVHCHGKDQLHLAKMEKLHCLGCHDFLGKKSVSLLPTAVGCRECHPAAAPVPGAPVTVVARPEMYGGPAPVAKGHEDCLGCHRPHGKPLQDPIDCLACHKQVLDAASKHYKDERLQSCRECHEPHKPDQK